MLRINYLMFIVKNRLTIMFHDRYNLEKGREFIYEAKTIAKNELFSTYCT